MGRIIGIQNFVANLAGIVAPIVIGRLKQVSGRYEGASQAVWLVLSMGVAAYVFLVREKHVQWEVESTPTPVTNSSKALPDE